ncbi:hypothetical protein U1Q18_006880 [Sarracenia purpurea var. burkii]
MRARQLIIYTTDEIPEKHEKSPAEAKQQDSHEANIKSPTKEEKQDLAMAAILSERREIDGLNEQSEEDARCLEHLQLQLLEEPSKCGDAERENAMLQNQ